MVNRCTSRHGGWRCDRYAGHPGIHEAVHVGRVGPAQQRHAWHANDERDAQEADAKDLCHSLGAP